MTGEDWDRQRPITEDEALEYISGICFKTGPPRRIGVELEWLAQDARNPAAHPAAGAAPRAFDRAAGLPLDGALTLEPGGQWELSSRPADSVAECLAVTDRDMALLRRSADLDGLRLVGLGHDPLRTPHRVLDHPRYAAMEEYFDRSGRSGRAMMCLTASIQVNVDAGTEGGETGYRRRWRLVHDLGPVLVAVFANSPLAGGRPSGWLSTRQAVWSRIDASRTLSPPIDGADPRSAYAAYALDAGLLCVRQPDGRPWTAPDSTFRAWIRSGGRRPTLDDLDYHLSTLFPPVRPRGHFELRMIDAQSGDDWHVAAAFTAALLEDPVAADAALAALAELDGWVGRGGANRVGPRSDSWQRAARLGPSDPDIRKAALACFAAADASLSRSGAPARLRERVADFADRHTARGRCPAHDVLESGPRAGSDHESDPHTAGSIAWN